MEIVHLSNSKECTPERLMSPPEHAPGAPKRSRDEFERHLIDESNAFSSPTSGNVATVEEVAAQTEIQLEGNSALMPIDLTSVFDKVAPNVVEYSMTFPVDVTMYMQNKMEKRFLRMLSCAHDSLNPKMEKKEAVIKKENEELIYGVTNTCALSFDDKSYYVFYLCEASSEYEAKMQTIFAWKKLMKNRVFDNQESLNLQGEKDLKKKEETEINFKFHSVFCAKKNGFEEKVSLLFLECHEFFPNFA